MPVVILILLIIVAAAYFQLQSGDDPKIPPASSPDGTVTRIVGGALAITLFAALLNATILQGTTATNIGLAGFAPINIVVVFFVALNKISKDKHK